MVIAFRKRLRSCSPNEDKAVCSTEPVQKTPFIKSYIRLQQESESVIWHLTLASQQPAELIGDGLASRPMCAIHLLSCPHRKSNTRGTKQGSRRPIIDASIKVEIGSCSN